MTETEIVIGIDIGGTTTSLGCVDIQGRLHAEATMATRGDQPAAQLVSRLHQAIEQLKEELPTGTELAGIGIGAPNANYLRGTVEHPVNLNWDESTNLVELVQSHYQLPVTITNDANAAALGEMVFGGARGMKDFIVITLGTGLGSGVVSNGGLVCGADGFAGELGHTIVDPDGRQCACGQHGCLETYVSATGLCRTVAVLLGELLDPSCLRTISFQELTSKMVYEAACQQDTIALTAFDRTARTLAMKLADAVAHTAPEAIFFCGGLATAEEFLIPATQRYLEKFLFPIYRGKVSLLPSSLPGSASAILGAAALIWHKLKGK